MQALLNDIELDVQELKCLIEAVSNRPDAALKSVAKRNILQMRSRLDMLLQQLDEESSPAICQPEVIVEPVAEPLPEPVLSATILADRIKPAGDLRSFISLNDSFRFSRELFGNDTELMNRVLQQIGEMNSLDMALAFVASKVKVEEENEVMADFVELLKKYFN